MKLILILWISFFEWYTRPNTIDSYRRDLAEDVYMCMEWSKQSYNQVMAMPVTKFKNYLKWKKDYEDERSKHFKAEMDK